MDAIIRILGRKTRIEKKKQLTPIKLDTDLSYGDAISMKFSYIIFMNNY